MTRLTPLSNETVAYLVRARGHLLRVARERDTTWWVASRPSGRGLRAERETPRLAVRAYLEDE